MNYRNYSYIRLTERGIEAYDGADWQLLNPYEHIDHRNVKITPISGLTGGGDITQSVNVGVDINNQQYINAATNHQVLISDGENLIKKTDISSIVSLASGGGSVAGNDGEIQFNNSGSFGATSNLVWNSNTGVELGTDFSINVTSSLYDSSDAVINLFPAENNDKPWITWYDSDNNPIAGIVAHEFAPDGSLHSEYSIETANSAGSLQTRLEVPYGTDTVTIQTQDAHFKVSAGYNFDVGTSAGLHTISRFYGDLWQYGSNDLGFGDKNWETDGLEKGSTKWEFYRNSSTAELLIHQADGSSDSSLHLRKSTKDWRIKNINPDIIFEEVGNERVRITEAGAVEAQDYIHTHTYLQLDEISEPSAPNTGGKIFIDSADSNLKVKFASGTVSSIATS